MRPGPQEVEAARGGRRVEDDEVHVRVGRVLVKRSTPMYSRTPGSESEADDRFPVIGART